MVTPQTVVEANEPGAQVAILSGVDLQRLVRGLNQIGLKPSGIIAILQAIKTAGALQADSSSSGMTRSVVQACRCNARSRMFEPMRS